MFSRYTVIMIVSFALEAMALPGCLKHCDDCNVTPVRPTPTATATATVAATPTVTATLTATPTITATLAATPTLTATATVAATLTATATATAAATPTATATLAATATATSTATSTSTATATATATSTATATPTATATAIVPEGSCQPANSLSVLVSGVNVTAYVPKGQWGAGLPGVSVVNLEGSSITPTLIPTANVVNSCASNSITGTTVCSANTNDVYLLSGTTLGSTLSSGGSGFILFSGGTCTNCGVAMDAVHNKALIALSIAGAPGFQFLDLATSTLEPAVVTSPFEDPVVSPAGSISEGILIDPINNLLLSASEQGNYEIASVATSTPSLTAPASFFENATAVVGLDSSGEDCSTRIALATAEQFVQSPSTVYIADLTQATFTPGMPGTWSAPSQNQILSESILTNGADGIAVAQGTHTGIVSGELGGNAITAIALPATSGSGTPAIVDWVTCSIDGFVNGGDPHTVTAYRSPNSGHAIGVLANQGMTSLAVVDLTQMLNTKTVPRTAGLHACASGALPGTVVSPPIMVP